MTLSRPALIALIAVLALVAAGAGAAYVNERNKNSTLEIRIDEGGLKIQGR